MMAISKRKQAPRRGLLTDAAGYVTGFCNCPYPRRAVGTPGSTSCSCNSPSFSNEGNSFIHSQKQVASASWPFSGFSSICRGT